MFAPSRARAPGKLVLSGAYSVLEGAPAIVVAVDRYVEADGARASELVTAEVREAIARGALDLAPAFDASALRTPTPTGSRKLGVGSSAAILLASLAARSVLSDDELASGLFPIALAAHRAAQGGGSGVDVAASAFGGVLRCELDGETLSTGPIALPPGTICEVFTSPVSAVTSELVARVRGASTYARRIDEAAVQARAAIAARSVDAFVAAVDAQNATLGRLGEEAGAEIVTPDVAGLAELARAEGACFGPSGAGGGDVAIFLGRAPSSLSLRRAAADRALVLCPMAIGARGVHRR